MAVSKTSDPTGAYWLYDYQYAGINDDGKFGIWPDAYYASFNIYVGPNGGGGLLGADLCAYDRVSMLQGLPATQQCFQQSSGVFGVLPSSLDGKVKPPSGEPAFFMSFGSNVLNLWKFHVDWTTPANSTLSNPTILPVASFSPACVSTGSYFCVPQPSPGSHVFAGSDRLKFRLSYRNFGTHEALVVNHSVAANSASGIRWYEIRSPNGTPVVQQQGTYAPNDGNWRWMASIAQDQAEDFVAGFSLSSTTTKPSIAWTGRLRTDSPGTMGQGEAVLAVGTGVETTLTRWGDYNNMTVDPTDDCTFWFTAELYASNGSTTWDTRIASVKFPACAANDFSIAVSPPSQSISPGGHVAHTVTTGLTQGVAESIALNVQDLPAGVSGSFSPTSVTAGQSATLTLSASPAAAATGTPGPTFTVIGTALSSLHQGAAQIVVRPCVVNGDCDDANLCTTDTCDPVNGCVYAFNTVSCDDGNACTVGDTCGGGVCAGSPTTAPPETQAVLAAANKSTYSWLPAANATQYDVVRGSTGAFPVGPGGGDEACFDNLPGPALTDATVPTAGTGFWYLSRGENACGIGTWGTQSNGSPRATTTCP